MQVVMPLDVGVRIEADDKVRTLIEVTERLDYGKLNMTYQRRPRRGEATPKQMFQESIGGNSQGAKYMLCPWTRQAQDTAAE